MSASGTVLITGDGLDPEAISYNCACEDGDADGRTLLDLRTALLRRLGYSAQIANPPPGMAELLDDFLRDAQEQLYMRYASLRTERYYRWPMTPGVRYYGINSNADLCDKHVSPYRITWAGIEDQNRAWMPLICGIPASFYTSDNHLGIPCRYELRQCIEVFPAPDDYYTLRIKGHFGLQPFSEDDDRCTIESHAVFLLALANAKAHYRQPDAANVFQQSGNYMGSLVAGSHQTRRYVPRREDLPPLPRPRMVRFDE